MRSVSAITIPGLLSLKPYFHSIPQDPSWNAVMPAIWLQLVQSASIVCTCIPSLKRVLADLQTGMMAGAISEFFELSVSGGRYNTNDGSGTRSRRRRSPYSVDMNIPSANTNLGIGDVPDTESSRTLLERRESHMQEQASVHDGQYARESQPPSSRQGLVPHYDEGYGSR